MATLFVEQLTVIDCSLLDPADGLAGESFVVDIELSGPLDTQGMVLDFSAVKRDIKRRIDALCDHRLLVPMRHPDLLCSERDGQLRLRFRDRGGQLWEHESPALAICGIPFASVNTETLAQWLQQRLQEELPAGMQLQLVLRSEAIDGAHYRYSHGLQKHEGACQRIAHGHRSRLQVWIDGTRRSDIEQQWAIRFRDIYIATHGHFVREYDEGVGKVVELRYRSQEGDYRLVLPQRRCYWLDTESTVEHIAAHLAQQIKLMYRGEVKVRAFEGVQKGAVACA